MAIAYRSSASAGNNSGGNLTINKPTGTVDNDIMVVVLYSEHSATAWTLPAGWAWWGGATGQQAFVTSSWTFAAWKRASSEGANYTFTHAGNAWRIGVISSFSGAITSGDPEDSTGPTGYNGTGVSDQATTLSSVTTNTDSDMLIGCSANFSGDALTAGSSDMTLASQLGGCGNLYKLQAAAGASGAKTLSNDGSGGWGTWHQAIKPPAAGVVIPVFMAQYRQRIT